MSTAKSTIQINKIAAASRQLNAAIRMFFANEDALATHTVASAAFRILRDVTQKRGKNFTSTVLRDGVYNIARRYAEGRLPQHELKIIENTGLVAVIESILGEVRAQGDNFDRSRISVELNKAGEQKVWPSKAANFLKHADRDADEHLPLDEIKNENLLMGACAAYLELMKMPTPEIMAFFAFWAAKNDMDVEDIGPEVQRLFLRLMSVEEPARHRLCKQFIRRASAASASRSAAHRYR
jgi:hypothetical protein